jgi:hypothetical protein
MKDGSFASVYIFHSTYRQQRFLNNYIKKYTLIHIVVRSAVKRMAAVTFQRQHRGQNWRPAACNSFLKNIIHAIYSTVIETRFLASEHCLYDYSVKCSNESAEGSHHVQSMICSVQPHVVSPTDSARTAAVLDEHFTVLTHLGGSHIIYFPVKLGLINLTEPKAQHCYMGSLLSWRRFLSYAIYKQRDACYDSGLAIGVTNHNAAFIRLTHTPPAAQCAN